MAIWTTADRDAIKAAILTAVSSGGFASVSIGGQTVAMKSLDELRRLLDMVQADLAASGDMGGLRFKQTVPPGAG